MCSKYIKFGGQVWTSPSPSPSPCQIWRWGGVGLIGLPPPQHRPVAFTSVFLERVGVEASTPFLTTVLHFAWFVYTRFSYHQYMVDALPAQFQSLIPPAPQPNYRFSEGKTKHKYKNNLVSLSHQSRWLLATLLVRCWNFSCSYIYFGS